MNRQNQNMPPDPRDYDMYSLFRTKERGEARRQNTAQKQQRSSYYDAYAQRAEAEQSARKEARRRQMQANAQYTAKCRKYPVECRA